MVQITAQSNQLNPYFVNLSITREIDGICGFSFEYPLSDSLSSNLISTALVNISVNNSVIFSGRITNVSDKTSNQTILRSVSGVGLVDDLRKKIIPPNILHNNEFIVNSFNPSYSNTVILDNSWTVTTESDGSVVTYLTSLQSSLSAISTFCQLTGFHYRYTNNKNLEIYKSLVSSGVTIQNTSNQGNYSIDQKTLIIDGEVSYSTDSTGVFNYVYGVGGTSDNGVNQITLRDVTVTDPLYPISPSPILPNTDSTYNATVYTNIESAPNTTVAYVVSSPVSIAKYGQIEKAIAKKDIHVTSSNTTTFSNVDRKEAATQLYRSIVEELKLNDEPTKTYSLNATGDFIDLKVGQTVLLKSSKIISNSGLQGGIGTVYDYNETLILTKYTVNFLENNTFNYQLELSNISKVQKGDIEVLSETVESVNDYERQRKGSVTTYPQYFQDSFDSTNPLTALFWIPEDFVYVDKLKLKVKISAFRSYSTGATSSSTSFASDAGGATTETSTGGGGTTQSSTSGGGTTQSSTNNADHSHTVNTLNHQHAMFANAGIGSFNSITAAAATLPANSWTVYDDGSLTGVKWVGNYSSAGLGTISTSDSGAGIIPTSSSTGAHAHNTTIPNHTHDTTIPNHTHNTTIGNHTHTINISGQVLTIVYGIFEDIANPPTGLRLFIDGIDYSTQVSIPDGFATTPSSIDSTFDLLLAVHNLGQFQNLFTPGIHQMELRCSGGRARGELHLYGQFYLQSK